MKLAISLVLIYILFFIKLASCFYEPWDDIKISYNNFLYDPVAADAQHAEMENNCSDAYEQGGICFDDCMFRLQYKIYSIRDWYGLQDDYGRMNIERNILQLQKLEGQDEGMKRPLNEALHKKIEETCDEETNMLMLGKEVKATLEQDPLEASKKLCSDIMTEQEKKKLAHTLDCVKNVFRNS